MEPQFMRMFPLNNVVFPHTLIPLRIFEPRYLEMVKECEDQDEPFGIVLIERGFEVGGGDARFSVGTAANILDSADLPGGHRAVVAAGTARVMVEEWLEDEAYPAARVRVLVEPTQPDTLPATEEIVVAEAALRRVLTLTSEMGHDVGPIEFELAADPTVAVYQLAGLAPLGALDAQKAIEAQTARARLQIIQQALEDEAALLQVRLAGG